MSSFRNITSANECSHLRAVITNIDATSQWAMRDIETILSTYLLQAETLGMPESFTRGLRDDVYELTQHVANDINCQAEYLGCNFKSAHPNHPRLSD
jgi:hypothetical protein